MLRLDGVIAGVGRGARPTFGFSRLRGADCATVVLEKRRDDLAMADPGLQQAMADFQRCLLERDHDLAETVLDDDFSLLLVLPSLAEMPRARWLDVLPDFVITTYDVREQTVAVDPDETCAAVLQRVAMSAVALGEDRSGVFVISDVWRRRPEGWRVWRRHSTPLSAARLPGAE